MEPEYIYILYGVSARKVEDDFLQKEYQKYLITYPHNAKKVPFERYLELEKSWNRVDPHICICREEIAFFTDREEALEAARENVCDYNDGGVNNYGMVERIPAGVCYPSTSNFTEYWLFKFKNLKDGYKDVRPDEDEMAWNIRRKYDMFFDRMNEEEVP